MAAIIRLEQPNVEIIFEVEFTEAVWFPGFLNQFKRWHRHRRWIQNRLMAAIIRLK